MGSAKTPSVPDPSKTYAQGIATNIKYAPEIASEEQKLRGQYDPQDVAESLGLQEQYGGQALGMYQNYLSSVDPNGTKIRQQLGTDVSNDLSSGTALPADLAREYDQGIRGAEAARGNVIGNSAITSEAITRGSLAQSLYQQRLANAGTFLSGDNTTQQLTGIAGLTTAATTPDRTDAYVNPTAGVQGQNTALQYYQSALAGGAAGGGNPWTAALASAGGAAAGAAVKYGASSANSYFSGLNSGVSSAPFSADEVSMYSDIANAGDP